MKYQGVIGTQVAVTGSSLIIIDDRIFRAGNRTMWEGGMFAVSVTQMGTVGFSVSVLGELAGITYEIASATNIAATTSRVMPLVPNATAGIVLGTTQFAYMGGIPMPRRIQFSNSATVGQTYSAVVSAMLWGH